MKHLVSHAQDGTIQLAIVDDDSGELDQIGTFIWPPGYGLTEAAILGTNLSQFLANGQRPATTPAIPAGTVVHQHDGPDDQRKPRRDERKKRQGRESYYRKKGYSREEAAALAAKGPQPGKPAPRPGHVLDTDVDAPRPPQASKMGPKPKAPNHRYIRWEEVAAVIDAHPEGIGCSDIAKDIMGYSVHWATKAVSNRLDNAQRRPDFPYQVTVHVSDGGLKKKRYHGTPPPVAAMPVGISIPAFAVTDTP